jgi:hypothetical protein
VSLLGPTRSERNMLLGPDTSGLASAYIASFRSSTARARVHCGVLGLYVDRLSGCGMDERGMGQYHTSSSPLCLQSLSVRLETS